VAGTLGVLVAGGAGARLGAGLPKALVALGGMTLLERAAGTLASVCDELVVVAPPALALALPAALRTRVGGVPRRVDDRPGARGPLAGVVAGLSVSPFERAVVLGVDFPFMEPAFLEAMLERLDVRSASPRAVVPAPGGIAQPLAAVYAPEAVAILAACHAEGEAAPSRALALLTVRRLGDAELEQMPGGLPCLFNLNTPEQLDEAGRRMAARVAR
jgi:molybdenum cofactor guanylyltransferase